MNPITIAAFAAGVALALGVIVIMVDRASRRDSKRRNRKPVVYQAHPMKRPPRGRVGR